MLTNSHRKQPKTAHDARFLAVAAQGMAKRGITSDRAISVALGRSMNFINRVRNGHQSATPEAWDALLVHFPEAVAIEGQIGGDGPHHDAATQRLALNECEKERDQLRQEVESLQAQLAAKDGATK